MSSTKKELIIDEKSCDPEFTKKIEKLSGQNVFKCYLCGKCSAGCPVPSDQMDVLPHEIIRRVQIGDESVDECETVWVCQTCFSCSVRCPKGIDVAKVMEAIRLCTLRRNKDVLDLSKIPSEKLRDLPTIAVVSALRKKTS